MAPLAYRIVTLLKSPKENHNSRIAVRSCEKYRELRLHSLETSPEAFASSFEVERLWGPEKTWERLNNPKATQLVALEGAVLDISGLSYEVQVDIIAQATWLGMIVLLGPEDAHDGGRVTATADPFDKMTAEAPKQQSELSSIKSEDSHKVLSFHLNGVFVTPRARSAGIGMALIKAALQKAQDLAATFSAGFKCSVLVNQDNISARRLYARAGFAEVGEETYVQQHVNGEGEYSPQTRVAVHMDYTSA